MNPDYRSKLEVIFNNPQPSYQVVAMKGDFDKAGLEEFRSKIDALVQNFTLPYLVFDFSDLAYVNSESIGYLMSLNLILINSQKKMVLVGIQPNVQEVLSMIGFLQVVDHYSSLAEFQAAAKL